jgi:hypothetical protein
MLTIDRLGRLDRRAILKGVSLGAGTVVLQPFLNAIAAEARGETPPPRVIFLLESNGLYPSYVQPVREAAGQTPDKPTLIRDGQRAFADRLADISLRDHVLPEALAALAPYKDRVTVIQGLSGPDNPGHGGGFSTLGCFDRRLGAVRQTADCALGEKLSKVIPVVGLGVSPNPDVCFITNSSVTAPRRPLVTHCQPTLAFQALFGSVAGGQAGRRFAARTALLDWIRGDIGRVRAALPQEGREKLDIYLDTFEELRTRQDRFTTITDGLTTHAPALDTFTGRSAPERFAAHCDLAVASLASGLTNVVTIDAGTGDGMYHTWKHLGINVDGHAIGHNPEDPKHNAMRLAVNKYHAERVATIAAKLAAIPEGNGSLLDSTLLVYLSDAAEAHHGTGKRWPVVMVGDMGGRLKAGGRLLEYPGFGKTGPRTTANLFLALLHAAGDRREHFGIPQPVLKDLDLSGPLAELLA